MIAYFFGVPVKKGRSTSSAMWYVHTIKAMVFKGLLILSNLCIKQGYLVHVSRVIEKYTGVVTPENKGFKRFQPAFGVRSTQMLVKIYNTYSYLVPGKYQGLF